MGGRIRLSNFDLNLLRPGVGTSARTLQRDIQRQPQKANNLPRVPDNNDFAFLIPQEYSITTTGNQFLQIDSHHNGKMLMFGSQESIEFLRNTPDWFLDGTFYTVPSQFLQLYTFHLPF